MIDLYIWSGGTELIQWFGSADQPRVLIFEPLFEERNRCRRLIAEMARELDKAGLSVAIPDLPGSGESLFDIKTLCFSDWTLAAQSACTAIRPAVIASFRGGVLVVPSETATPHWTFAPEQGSRIVRDLERARAAAGPSSTGYAGHMLSSEFVEGLAAATLPTGAQPHIIRLETDAALANQKIPGAPLWRRAEPGEDSALSKALADSILAWGKQCGAW